MGSKQQTLQYATKIQNNNKNKQFSFRIYILLSPIFLCLFKYRKLSTIFILDVKDQDECENCKEIMTLIDTILSNQEIEDYIAKEISTICSWVSDPDLNVQCTDLITNYFDDIWELLINKFLRADLICEEAGFCH